ncbi:HepT-like ribonuclease domain-containing protein [Bordetella genomosp. 13]|nr:HepT-like ribonuclease domain-containing protein [Bordetella genomosp. 13]
MSFSETRSFHSGPRERVVAGMSAGWLPHPELHVDEAAASEALARFGLRYVRLFPCEGMGDGCGMVVEAGPTTSLQTLYEAELSLSSCLGVDVQLTTTGVNGVNPLAAPYPPLIPGMCLMHPRDEMQEPARRIFAAIERIQRYVAQTDAEAFLADSLVQDAVLQNLRALGMAILDITDIPGVHEAFPEVEPWFHILVQAVAPDSIDWHVLWNTIHQDLPRIGLEVETLLRALADEAVPAGA